LRCADPLIFSCVRHCTSRWVTHTSTIILVSLIQNNLIHIVGSSCSPRTGRSASRRSSVVIGLIPQGG
jgi:hypothetical protein